MSVLVLGMLYSPRAIAMAQPLQFSPQAYPTPLITHLISNATITCVFNGVEYFVSSPSSNMITCQSILRNVATFVADSANSRTVTGILWSCLATVFACTWVSVHPNIPHPDATEWQIRRHRFFMMLCGLVAPELIVLWALRQWMSARFLVRKMKEKNIDGFTIVHGHFMQMGGFMLYSKGARFGIIEDYNELVSAIVDWKFVLPTAEEIRDRSKGDGLAKALVVGQTAWFVAQCLSRCVAGLSITEMELVTLAFAALNGIIYFLWWNKPLDVRYAVQVIRQTAEDNGQDVVSLSYQNSFATTTLPSELPRQSLDDRDAVQVVRQSEDNEPEVDNLLHQNSSVRTASSSDLSFDSRGHAHHDDLRAIRRLLAKSRIGRLLAAMKLYFTPGNKEREERHFRISVLHTIFKSHDTYAATAVASAIGILFGAVHCVAWNFHFLSHQERTLWHIWSTIITATPTLLFAKSVLGYLVIAQILDSTSWDYGLASNLTTLRFASNSGIASSNITSDNGIALNNNTSGNGIAPTNNIASNYITAFPSYRLSSRRMSLILIFMRISHLGLWATVLLIPAYVVARVGLFIQALAALRDLQPAEQAQVQWVNFLPHI